MYIFGIFIYICTESTSFLCSTRWRMVGYIALSFAVTYMHRVNLSLAVVCMVNTTHSGTTESQYTVRDTDKEQTSNSSLNGILNNINVSRTNVSIVEDILYTVRNENSTLDIEKDHENPCGDIISEEEMVRYSVDLYYY